MRGDKDDPEGGKYVYDRFMMFNNQIRGFTPPYEFSIHEDFSVSKETTPFNLAYTQA